MGDVVLLMDKKFHRSDWPKAIVTAAETGPDGFVRTVTVRTSIGSVFKRDIQKLALLEAAEEMSATVTSDSSQGTQGTQGTQDELQTSTQLRRSKRVQEK
jgi:hypothetical protein